MTTHQNNAGKVHIQIRKPHEKYETYFTESPESASWYFKNGCRLQGRFYRIVDNDGKVIDRKKTF